MRLPRNLSGADLAKALRVFGYESTRQSGSHIRLTTTREGQHHVTVPNHPNLRIGTVAGILSDVAAHFHLTREELLEKLFGR
jgi:predicted RNA binding protein YcfA (HicA-like mRNA interferase family)